jgi:hypothetical protein
MASTLSAAAAQFRAKFQRVQPQPIAAEYLEKLQIAFCKCLGCGLSR